MEYEIYPVGDELAHHGTKGMKWGVRRYQNKDGSLTNAGKKRYNAELAKVRQEEKTLKNRKATKAKIDKLEARKKAVEEGKKEFEGTKTGKSRKAKGSSEEAVKKTAKNMTDEELITAINRARLEDTYNQLRPAVEKHPVMKKMVNEVIVPAAVNYGRKALESALDQAVKKALGGKADGNSIEALTQVRDKLKLQSEIKKYKNPDSEINWDNMLKKQQYEANEKKAKQEAADAKAAAKQAKADAKAEAKQAKAESKSSKSEEKVYEGTVEGAGNSSKTYSQGKSWTNNSKVYDADYWEVSDSGSTSSGKSYTSNYMSLPVSNVLSLPAPRDDD